MTRNRFIYYLKSNMRTKADFIEILKKDYEARCITNSYPEY